MTDLENRSSKLVMLVDDSIKKLFDPTLVNLFKEVAGQFQSEKEPVML